MSLYGYHRDTTPQLESFAEEATVYEQARAPSHWSLPSHVSILTGQQVAAHRISGQNDRLAPGNTVFDALSERGYRTGAFSRNLFLTARDTGLADSFDVVANAPKTPAFSGLAPWEYRDESVKTFLSEALREKKPVRSIANAVISRASRRYPEKLPERFHDSVAGATTPDSIYTDQFLDWTAEDDGPWAACINYMGAHTPFTPGEEYRKWSSAKLERIASEVGTLPLSVYLDDVPWWKLGVTENLYDAAIREVDDEFGRLIKELKRRNEFENTLIVVTSDHGEAFGEYDALRDFRLSNHLLGGHEVTLHVPLLVKHPGQTARERIASLATPANFPELVNKPDSEALLDNTVLASCYGIPLEVQRERIEEEHPNPEKFTGATHVRYDDAENGVEKTWKWGETIKTERVVDAQTTIEGDATHRDMTLFEEINDAGIRTTTTQEIDSETKEQLKELGYR